MFATLPPISQHTFQPSYYAPTVSSPLSSSPLRTSPLAPRDGNINANFQMSSPTPPNKRARDENAYSRRIVKKNPLVHRDSDDGRETRRKLFLRRVREDSEEKRWEKRGGDDEIMRAIWMAEKRRREEKRAREARACESFVEEEDNENYEASRSLSRNIPESQIEEMADEVALQEYAEMEALLEMLEAENCEPPSQQQQQQRYEDNNTPYGSDDDEYDQLFMEMSMDDDQNIVFSQQADGSRAEDHDMMDMT